MEYRKLDSWKLSLVVLFAIVAIAGFSQAQTSRFADASGNGHNIEDCDPDIASEHLQKFGAGFHMEEGTQCNSQGNEFVDTISKSGTFSLNATQVDIGSFFDLEGNGEDARRWRIRFDFPKQDVIISYLDSLLTQRSCTLNFTDTNRLEEGVPFSGWFRIEPGDALNPTVNRVKLFNSSGQSVERNCNIDQEPETVNDGLFRFQSDFMQINVTEIRYFDEEADATTLDQIADPTNPNFELEVEGTEEAVWFLESIPAQEVESVDSAAMAIHYPEDIKETDNWTASFWVTNRSLSPVEIIQPPTVSLSRPAGVNLGWWNTTTESESMVLITQQAQPRTDGSFIWEASFTNVSPGTWTISVIAQTNTSEGTTVNLTSHDTIEVEEHMPIEIAGMQASALIEIGIWGGLLLLSLINDWLFPGIIATMNILGPPMRNAGSFYPIDFVAGLFLFIFAIWMHRYAHFIGERLTLDR